MIRRLRSRFIRIVMESFLVVLALTLLSVNCVYRHNVYAGIDSRLTYLAESDMGPPVGMVASTPQEVRGWVDMNRAGIMNETSYFIFSGYMIGPILTHQLDILSASTGLDASVLLKGILAGTETRGNVRQYRYLVASRDVPYKVVFLRCDIEFDSMRALLNTSLLVGVVSFGLVLLLVTLLSGTAMGPFAQNIENQKRFIANASHELKTPLGVIISDLDLQILESGETEWLTNAQIQADHLALLIEQLTTYTLLDEKKREITAVPVDLSAVSENLLSDFRPLALSREQNLISDIQEGVSVQGNDDALRTMLSVLLDNAVKYTPEGGEIRLTLRRDRKTVIQVENTFPDAREMDLAQLFERFYRAPEHRADQEGHGLGLSIAHDIAAMYGGAIRADAPDDSSLRFTVELP